MVNTSLKWTGDASDPRSAPSGDSIEDVSFRAFSSMGLSGSEVRTIAALSKTSIRGNLGLTAPFNTTSRGLPLHRTHRIDMISTGKEINGQ